MAHSQSCFNDTLEVNFAPLHFWMLFFSTFTTHSTEEPGLSLLQIVLKCGRLMSSLNGPPMAGSSTSSASPLGKVGHRTEQPHSDDTNRFFFRESGKLRNVFPQ